MGKLHLFYHNPQQEQQEKRHAISVALLSLRLAAKNLLTILLGSAAAFVPENGCCV